MYEVIYLKITSPYVLVSRAMEHVSTIRIRIKYLWIKVRVREWIKVSVDEIEIGIAKKWRNWWTWERYLDTWRIINEDPEMSLEELPLCSLILRRFTEISGYGEDKAAEKARAYLNKKISLFLSIKENGYDPYYPTKHPIRVYMDGSGISRVCQGVHRVSILKYLKKPKKIYVHLSRRNPLWIEIASHLPTWVRRIGFG